MISRISSWRMVGKPPVWQVMAWSMVNAAPQLHVCGVFLSSQSYLRPNCQGNGLGIGLWLGMGPGNAIPIFFSSLKNVVNIFVFVGSVASYECLIRYVSRFKQDELSETLYITLSCVVP